MSTALLLALLLASGAPLQHTTSQAPAVQPYQPTAMYYFLLGRQREDENKIEEAIAAERKAIALDPKSAELHAELAGLFARQERAAEAVAEAKQAIAIDPRNAEANRVYGSVLAAYANQKRPIEAGDDPSTYPQLAAAALEIARSDGSFDLNTDLLLARLYLQTSRAAKAVPLLRHIVNDQPGYAEGYLLLSQALQSSGDAAGAIAALSTAVDQDPTFFRGLVALAQLYEGERRWADAADTWARAEKINPQNADLTARRVGALINAGKAAEARTELQTALKAAPDDATLLYLLAQAERQSGDLAAAEATAGRLRQADPTDVRGVYVLAQILESQNRHQETVDLLRPEIEKLKDQPDAGSRAALLLSTEGLALQELKQYDAAIAAFKAAADRAPDDPLRQVLLIQGYTEAGRYADAVAAGEVAVKKFNGDHDVLYQLGAAQDRAGRAADAEKTFRDLLQQDPLDANALNYLGYMLAESGSRLDEAVSLIQRALKIDPDNPSYLDSLGLAYLKQGHPDLADVPLTTAASKLATNSVVQEHLGDLRLQQQRLDDAIAAWQRALAGDGHEIDRAKIEQKIKTARAQLKR